MAARVPAGRPHVDYRKTGSHLVGLSGGEKIPVSNTPPVYFQGQNGMHGVFLSPHYAKDHNIYLTYAEPGEYGGGLALARAKLRLTATSASLET